MFISDTAIRVLIDTNQIEISPKVKPEDIRQVGIRVHLSNEILIAEPNQTLDLTNPTEIKYQKVDLDKDNFVLEPGMFVLGSTMEKIKLPRDIVMFIDGRSTIARLGVTVHVSATVADGKYDQAGAITLEIKNLGQTSIKLVSGYPIGMIYFSKLTEPVKQNDQSQYKGQSNTAAPNLNYKTGKDL